MYSGAYLRDIEQMLERLREAGSGAAAEELKARYTRRMYDLSEFMKGLKQRFTQWFNGSRKRTVFHKGSVPYFTYPLFYAYLFYGMSLFY